MTGDLVAGRIALVLLMLVPLLACSNPEVAKQRAFERGNAYFEDAKYNEAIIEYRNALAQDARFVEARQKLADAYVATGATPAALREFIRLADLLPDDADAQIRAGHVHLLGRQFEDARARAERAIATNPGSAAAHVLLANATAGLRDLDGAIEEIEEAITLEPLNSRTHENFAALQAAAGRNAEAEALFKKAVELDPRSITAVLGLAGFYWGTEQPEAAEPLLKRAVEIAPDDFLANRAMAAFYLSTARPLEAEEHIKSLARIAATPRAQLALADYYLMTGRIEQGEAVLRPLTSDAAVGPTAQVGLAQVAYARGEAAGAHELVDAAIARQAQSVPALALKARFLLAETKLGEAEAFAARAVAAGPSSAAAHYLRGMIQLRRNDSAAAVQSFNQVLNANPRATAAKVQLARLLLARGAVDDGVRMAREVLLEEPANLGARLALLRSRAARGDVTGALADVAPLLREFPSAAAVHAAHGALLLQKPDAVAARRAFARAAELQPDSIEALGGLVAVDLVERKGADAAARVEQRLAAQPDDPALLLLAARAYAVGGERAKMEAALRRVIEIAPASDQASWMLGQYYLSERQPEAALAQFDRVANRSGNVAASTMAAMVIEGEGRIDEAALRYEQILDRSPDSVVAANNLAWIYAERGERLDQALRLAQRAAERSPKDPRISDTVGWIHYKRNLPLLAVPQFERSIALDPDNPEFHFHLGLALSRSGDAARARTALERALELRPDFNGSDEARKVLATIE